MEHMRLPATRFPDAFRAPLPQDRKVKTPSSVATLSSTEARIYENLSSLSRIRLRILDALTAMRSCLCIANLRMARDQGLRSTSECSTRGLVFRASDKPNLPHGDWAIRDGQTHHEYYLTTIGGGGACGCQGAGFGEKWGVSGEKGVWGTSVTYRANDPPLHRKAPLPNTLSTPPF